MSNDPNSKTVVQVANEAIHGERAKFYGHPSVNFDAIAQGWTAYMRAKLAYALPALSEDEVDALTVQMHDVAQLMIILKAMRGAKGYHRDSAVDEVGYAALDAVVSGDDPFVISE